MEPFCYSLCSLGKDNDPPGLTENRLLLYTEKE